MDFDLRVGGKYNCSHSSVKILSACDPDLCTHSAAAASMLGFIWENSHFLFIHVGGKVYFSSVLYLPEIHYYCILLTLFFPTLLTVGIGLNPIRQNHAYVVDKVVK